MEEDNLMNDGESSDSPNQLSPKTSGKKLKLNDGSSQNSLQETDLNYLQSTSTTPTLSSEEKVPSLSKDENVDSGVSADKSESTSSDDKSASTSAGPSNEIVNIAASGSNVQAILLNIRQPNHRNYRKRKPDDCDTDSNASSKDSDDLSAAEEVHLPLTIVLSDDESVPETEDNDNPRVWEVGSSDSINSTDIDEESESSRSSTSAAGSSTSMQDYESDASNLEVREAASMNDDNSDTEDEARVPWRTRQPNQTSSNKKLPAVLLKEKPKHDYFFLKEIINREMGLTFPYGKTTKEDVIFCQKFYGSLHAVSRLKRMHTMSNHKGCVNSLNFHPEGKLLVSGSDDMLIIIWDWASNQMLLSARTGHKSNVFQSKFLFLNAQSQLNIATCARDGQVRLIQCAPSGGGIVRRRLFTHSRAAHKLHVTPTDPHSILSAGEDGLIVHMDVRGNHADRLVQVKDETLRTIPLYSIHGHPLNANEFIVAGRDTFIRMYDRRKCAKHIALYTPTFFDKKQASKKHFNSPYLTCAIYNHNGRQILGSYNDEDIYLFDVVKDVYDRNKEKDLCVDGYRARYSGHKNSSTFKGVSFFGPNSEYVVSGSDCAHIYIWSTKHESIVHWVKGDRSVVNCVEPHPKNPVLASSGLDKDVKIWIPKATYDPPLIGLEKVVRHNGKDNSGSPLFNDFLPTLYSAWRHESRMRDNDETPRSFGGNIEFEGNVCTTF